MSVRRLAEDAVQPARFAFSGENEAWADGVLRKYPEGRQQSAVIPLLMRAQEQDGWVTKAAIEHVADRLRMPLIRVLEVATFYTQFQLKPVGSRAHVQVCGTTPCLLRGSDDLKAVCRDRIHEEQFHLNQSGTLSWEEVECLGACVNAPMVMIFKDTYEDLTPERFAEIIDAFDRGEGAGIKPGPQTDRHLAAPAGGLTTLTSLESDEHVGGREEGGPAAQSAPEQGNGSGGASVPPSQAGRLDTHAAETDSSMESPGSTVGAANTGGETVKPELASSTGPGQSGSGQTAGQQHGPTGQEERDRAKFENSASSVDPENRRDGPLADKGATAERAVVQDNKFVGEPKGPEGDPETDLSGRDNATHALLENQRRGTDDESGGPVAIDVFSGAPDENEEPVARGEGQRPHGLLDQPPEQRDDLQRINGIGPVLQAKLNELGVFQFAQIARWSEAELLWIDNHLNFRGRALRERWVEQAQALQSESSDTKSD